MNLHLTSKIQAHRKLHLPWSKRAHRFHQTCRLLIIRRIRSSSRNWVLRVLDELSRQIIVAAVAQFVPLIVAIEQIERFRGQLQMIPFAQVYLPDHSQIHGRVVGTDKCIASISRQPVIARVSVLIRIALHRRVRRASAATCHDPGDLPVVEHSRQSFLSRGKWIRLLDR